MVDALRPVAVDIFAGAGGMSLGFESAGFDVVAAVDSDPVHLATHHYNFPLTADLSKSVADIQASDVIEVASRGFQAHHPGRSWDGVIDCLFGGPCCQSFSVIGRADPGDHRTQLVGEFARLVEQLQPRTFVMENVPGLLHRKHRHTLTRLIDRFHRAGYDLAGDGVITLDAVDFGVPQRRSRVFILGTKRGTLERAVPPSGPGVRLTAAEALDDLVDADLFDELLESDEVNLGDELLDEMAAKASPYVRGLRRKQRSDLSWPRQWGRSLLTSSRRTTHGQRVSDRFRKLAPGERDRVSRMPRLDGNEPAPTLRAGTGRDHGSFTSCRPIHHTLDRVITVREAARLHGFPDWFRFHTTKWHGFRQVGNAVPPPLAKAVASQMVRVLGASIKKPDSGLSLGESGLLALTPVEAAIRMGMDPEDLPPDVRRLRGKDDTR